MAGVNNTGNISVRGEWQSIVFPEEWERARSILLPGICVILPLGTVGNILNLIIMNRRTLKKISTCFYMLLLALADTEFLWVSSSVYWVKLYTRWRINPEMFTDCKLVYFLGYLFSDFSSFILAIMSTEECFALYFPSKAETFCTVKLAKKISLITAIILVIFNSQYFFVIAVQENNGVKHCGFVNVPENYRLIYNRIDSVLYSYGPAFVMCLSSAAIIYKLLKCKKLVGTNPFSNQSIKKATKQSTMMLLGFSVLFILLNLPVSIYFSIFEMPSPVPFAITMLCSYSNHALNGIIYCVLGSKYRRELVKLLRCRRKNKVAVATH